MMTTVHRVDGEEDVRVHHNSCTFRATRDVIRRVFCIFSAIRGGDSVRNEEEWVCAIGAVSIERGIRSFKIQRPARPNEQIHRNARARTSQVLYFVRDFLCLPSLFNRSSDI